MTPEEATTALEAYLDANPDDPEVIEYREAEKRLREMFQRHNPFAGGAQ